MHSTVLRESGWTGVTYMHILSVHLSYSNPRRKFRRQAHGPPIWLSKDLLVTFMPFCVFKSGVEWEWKFPRIKHLFRYFGIHNFNRFLIKLYLKLLGIWSDENRKLSRMKLLIDNNLEIEDIVGFLLPASTWLMNPNLF